MGAVYAVAAAAARAGWCARLSSSSSPRAVLVAALAAWTMAALMPLARAACRGGDVGGGAAGRGGVGRDLADRRELPVRRTTRRRDARRDRLVQRDLDARDGAGAAADADRQPGGLLATLALSAAGSVAALVATFALPARPGAHEPEAAQAAVGREYSLLLRAGSWLLPMSYILCAVMAPLLPHRLAAVSGGTAGGGVAALWMVARFATLLAMWRTGFWHGRWGTLALAAGALARPGRRDAGAVAGGAGGGPGGVRRRHGPDLLRRALLLAGGGPRRGRRGRHVRGADRLRLLRGTAARSRRAGGRRRPRTPHRRPSRSPGWWPRLLDGALRRYLRRVARADRDAGRRAASAARSSAAISRMPSWLEPIVSGASVRSRKRARSPSSRSANRIAGSVTPAARSWRRIRMPCVSARRRRVSSSRPRGRPALVHQPVGRRAAKIQVQQQPVRAGRSRARLGEVARGDERRSRRPGNGGSDRGTRCRPRRRRSAGAAVIAGSTPPRPW